MFRAWLRSLCALVAAAAFVLTGWRVLAPAEVLAPASTPYPALAAHPPGVTGRTNAAPLIVDGRLRVYAAKRQVRADAPVDGKTVMTPRWSFRRWPQQLSGVVAIGPTVVSRWSDGELVAIDGRSGELAWRAEGPPAPGYRGHRIGAGTVWAPPGLHVAAGIVVVTGGRQLSGYDVHSGARRWTTEVPATCTDGFTTAGGQYVCPTGCYDTTTGRPLGSFPTGPYAPVGCAVAAAHCAGLRDGAGQGWFTDGPRPRRVEALDRPGSTIAGGLVFFTEGGSLRAAEPAGAVLRGYPGDARVLGASAGHILLLTAGRGLLVVDPRTGASRAEFPLAVGTEHLTWNPGRWQVTDGHVAIERLAVDAPADPETPGYYFTVDTVIIAAV